MWKESYRIGVDTIDQQHMALFEMAERLLEAIKKPDTIELKKECESAIIFMQNYVIEHFKAEEEYQKSIHYAGYTEHCHAHREFTSQVLEYAEKLTASNFDMSDVRDFAGMVTAWLTYHVAGADQKIVSSEPPEKIIVNSISKAVHATMKTMAYINKNEIKVLSNCEDLKSDVVIAIELTGDVTCTVEYGFSETFVYKLIKKFLHMDVKSLDHFTCTLLLEITNIIHKNAVHELLKSDVHCRMGASKLLKPPVFSATDHLIFDMRIGKLKVGICL